MAAPWSPFPSASPGGGSSTAWSPFPVASTPTKSSEHHGLLGKIIRVPIHFTEHLATDVKNAAFGLPTGLITLAEHPVRGVQDMGKAVWHDWSPLFTGHPDTFIKNFYAHPLAPILDVTAILTGGAGAAAKVTNLVTHAEYKAAIASATESAVSRAAAKGVTGTRAEMATAGGFEHADVVSHLSKLGKWGRPGTRILEGTGEYTGITLPRPVSGNPFVRARQAKMQALGERLANASPGWWGSEAKIRNLSQQAVFNRGMAKQASMSNAAKAALIQAQADLVRTVKHAEDATVGAQATVIQVVHAGQMMEMAPRDVAITVWAHHHPQLVNFGFKVDPTTLKTKTRSAAIRKPLETAPASMVKDHLAQAEKPVGHEYLNQQFNEVYRNLGVAPPRGGVIMHPPKAVATKTHTQEEWVQAPKGFLIARKDAGIPTSVKIESGADLEHFFLRKMGALSARKWVKRSDMHLDSQGRAVLIREGTVKAFGEETYQASKLVRAAILKPTQIWKRLVLAPAPRYFVNNAVGNLFMFALMSHPRSIAALSGVYKDIFGDAVSSRFAKNAMKTYEKRVGVSDATESVYGQLYHSGYSQEQLYGTSEAGSLAGKEGAYPTIARQKRAKTKLGRTGQNILKGTLPVTHALAERGLRRAATVGFLKGQPEIRALMKNGMSFDEAVKFTGTDMAFRYRVNTAIDNTLGDYHHITPLERQIRNYVPFYTWIRAISRHTTSLARERPAVAAGMQLTGEMGVEKTKEILGDLPEFLKGAVPLELLGFHHSTSSRAGILTTQGMNPFATIPDAINAVGGVDLPKRQGERGPGEYPGADPGRVDRGRLGELVAYGRPNQATRWAVLLHSLQPDDGDASSRGCSKPRRWVRHQPSPRPAGSGHPRCTRRALSRRVRLSWACR